MAGKMDALMAEINKEFKEDLLHKGIAEYDYERIPFTSPRLNYMTFGGIPMGKLIEFYGEEHGGKTTTCLDIVANYQNMESMKADENPDYVQKTVVYADLENTLDVVWAQKLGVDVDNMYIFNPTNQGAETIFERLLAMIETGEIGLMIIDSIGVMVSNQALEKSVEERTYGGIAMALTNFSKKAEMLCHKYKCTIIGINQMRADLNSQFGGMTTTGGQAWKHNVSVRLEFRMGKYIDEKGNDLTRGAENPAGNYVLVSMKKNKTCPPTRRTGFYTLNYANGIDYLKDLVEVAIKFNLIDKSGAWYSIIDPETGEQAEKLQGAYRVYEYLENVENRDLLMKIEAYIDEQIKNRDGQDLDPARAAELAEN